MDQSPKRGRANGFSFLPQHIIFVILLQLPAEFLWICARRVCRTWADIISDPDFVRAHFLKSKDVLLVKESAEPHHMHYLEKESRRFRSRITGAGFICPGVPSNSCRGLCIFLRLEPSGTFDPFDNQRRMNLGNFGTFYVANPMTRQIRRLPSLGRGWYEYFSLAYIDQRMEYEAVCLFSDGSTLNLFVFSFGVGVSWRKLNHIPKTTLEGISRLSSLPIGEFLYVLQGDTTIAMINLCDETVRYMQFPHGNILKSFGLQKRGGHVSCMVIQGDHLNVWMLKGPEWFKVCEISNDLVIRKLCDCDWSPIGWLDNCLIFAARSRLFFWVYYADRGETKVFSLNNEFCWRYSLIHRNTLVKW